MAYLYIVEYVGGIRTAQVYKISGEQEWAVKYFEMGTPDAEQRFDNERAAEQFAKDWTNFQEPKSDFVQLEETLQKELDLTPKTKKKPKTSTGE